MATAVRTERKKLRPTEEKKANFGKVVQVIGPVLDVEFESEHLPELYNALRIREKTDAGTDIDDVVDRRRRPRNEGRRHRRPITVPVGEAALGRILNVLGNPVDNGPPIPDSV